MIEATLQPPALSRESFAQFSQFIERELGIKMPPAKRQLLQSRLQRRLRDLHLASLDDYARRLFDPAAGAGELVHFCDAVTTNKTDFFREPAHFDALTRTALPALAPAAGPWSLRLWCAGCSSGEEAYTLAMVLAEFAAQRPGFEFAIHATDISTRVLEHAAAGIYHESRIGPIAPALRTKYLMRSRDRTQPLVRIVPELRRRIVFERLNFMDPAYGAGRFDAVFFRNVMIYFDKPTQEAVINKLCRHLEPGGFLFVGHSESLAGLAVPLRCAGSAVYQRLR